MGHVSESERLGATRSIWRDRIVKLDWIEPEQLLANPQNFRIHPRFQREALNGALDEIGWIQPVIVQQYTDIVVDGHLRVSLAIERQESRIPILIVDLDDEEVAKALATIDQITELAVKDKKKLKELADELRFESTALTDLIASLAVDASDGGGNVSEYVLSPELLERSDYLVIVFDNELDWRAACDEFGVTTVYEKPPGTQRKGVNNKGVGRVIQGKELLRRIKGEIDADEVAA